MHHAEAARDRREELGEPRLEPFGIRVEEIDIGAVEEAGIGALGIVDIDRNGVPAALAERRREIEEVVVGIVQKDDRASIAGRGRAVRKAGLAPGQGVLRGIKPRLEMHEMHRAHERQGPEA